jgi:integrase
MSPLRQALADYLAVRRALGYKLARAEKLLGQFVSFIEDAGATTITTADAITWATLPGRSPWWHAQRLSMARGFATHLHASDPAAEIPPPHVIPVRAPRATPYLYSAAEVAALMAATSTLSSQLRAATYQTLIGLLAATGMRVGEAIRLDRPDFDPGTGVLTVRNTKFGKTRLVPLHPTTAAALAGYLQLRDQLHPGPADSAVFISPAGTRLAYCNVHATWRLLVRRAGLRPRSPNCRPRPHDLRHSFAVASLLDAYAARQDGQARLAVLATYLGHVNPAATYWYLSAAPELLALAGQRLDEHQRERP